MSEQWMRPPADVLSGGYEREVVGRHGEDPHTQSAGCDSEPKCIPLADVPGLDDARPNPQGFVTKDSGRRQEYASGMRRDLQDGKARFDLIFPEGVPYADQLLTRFAELLMRGAEKYGENNWQLANSAEEMNRFKASGLRHMIQWHCGETDEDHAAAVIFNLMAYEATKRKLGARDAS